MTQDRTYFRMLSDSALAEAARYCDNDLAIVLGERLRDLLDVEDQIEALKTEIQELNHRCDTLTYELTALENDQ
jgi:predicted  nucleic acid-binding Zn-ribbon protein